MIGCNNERLNFNNICRLCMRHDGAMSSIFTDDTDGMIPSRILYCLSLKVLVNDGLPVLICERCKYQLNCSFKFKTQCENSDATLRKYVGNITLRTEIKKEFQDEASRFDNVIDCSDFSQQDEDCFTSVNIAASKQQFITDPNEQANIKLENANELPYACDTAWNCNESSAEVSVDAKQYSINNEGEQRVGVNVIGDGTQIRGKINTPYNEGEEKHTNDLSMEMPHSGTTSPAFKNVVTSYKVPHIKVKMKERSVTLNSNFGGKSMIYVKELCNMNQNSKKQYTCHLCFQSYAGRSGLWQHLQKHSGRQYVCSVCNKHFTRGNILKHHERTHTEVSSGIICPVCKKTFLNVMQLKRHEIDHLIDWSTAMQS